MSDPVNLLLFLALLALVVYIANRDVHPPD